MLLGFDRPRNTFLDPSPRVMVYIALSAGALAIIGLLKRLRASSLRTDAAHS